MFCKITVKYSSFVSISADECNILSYYVINKQIDLLVGFEFMLFIFYNSRIIVSGPGECPYSGFYSYGCRIVF